MTMADAAILTIEDLRSTVIQEWDQRVVLSVPFGRGPPLTVVIEEGVSLPIPLFQYQLRQAMYEATASEGVKWWCQRFRF